jgi:hypothetical protein
MPRTETFQDLPLRPKRADIELWRWLQTDEKDSLVAHCARAAGLEVTAFLNSRFATLNLPD